MSENKKDLNENQEISKEKTSKKKKDKSKKEKKGSAEKSTDIAAEITESGEAKNE